MTEPCDLTAVEARRLIGTKRLSPSELLESCIARIEAVDHAVNAIPARDFDRARKTAKQADDAVMKGDDLPPLHGLPIGIHAGSTYRHPVTPVGWPSYYTEDYVNQAPGFQSQLTSLMSEGVFAKFPDLTVVLMESGVSWLPAYLWRLTKFWKGLRNEIPWVSDPPASIVRDRVRMTLQPFDAPLDDGGVVRLMEHIGSDEILLFSTDYPHWQFDGRDVLPAGMDKALAAKIMADNPLKTYPRLKQA